MTEAQVRALLGEPRRVHTLGDSAWWYYASGAFSSNRVDGWREPD
jgi:outer membrane protein assembly factor BamE (lipoprotein component of BamABCDE complex)